MSPVCPDVVVLKMPHESSDKTLPWFIISGPWIPLPRNHSVAAEVKVNEAKYVKLLVA